MKIVKVEAFPIQAEPIDTRAYWGSRAWGSERAPGQAELSTEYPVPLRRRFVYSRTIDTVIVRIETDTGLVGWGEAKAPVAPQATARIIELLLAEVLIGADPHTDWLPESVLRDQGGFVLTGPDLPPGTWPLDRDPFPFETSLPGVLAGGDVRHGSVKRVASAVGEGSMSVRLGHQYLALNGHEPQGAR